MKTRQWCLILGGSKGLGYASAKKMAAEGYGLIVIHRDRKTDLEMIASHFDEIRSSGAAVIHFNKDAIREESRMLLIEEIQKVLPAGEKIKVLLHSIAKGNLKPMGIDNDSLTGQDFQLTIQAMAISLYDWTRDLLKAQLFAEDTRIIAFTSEGNTRAMEGYAAVSAAKTSLEAIVRNIALEMAPLGIKANCVQAGVTDTEALRMIPGSDKMKAIAVKRNPHGQLTEPEDVANVVYLLSRDEARWITGTVIKADGGESLR